MIQIKVEINDMKTKIIIIREPRAKDLLVNSKISKSFSKVNLKERTLLNKIRVERETSQQIPLKHRSPVDISLNYVHKTSKNWNTFLRVHNLPKLNKYRQQIRFVIISKIKAVIIF